MTERNLTTDVVDPLKKISQGMQEIGSDLLPHTRNGDINKARNELFTEWAVLNEVIDYLEELGKIVIKEKK